MAQSDDSEKICKKYLELYPDNIKYLYQENQGSNIARNKGIKLGNSFYQFIHDLEKNGIRRYYVTSINKKEINELFSKNLTK